MNRLSATILSLCITAAAFAQMPERNAENIKKYTALCRKHIYKDMKGMYREAGQSLPYPFLAPGSNQYLDMLWDWDSWLSNIALRQILLENGSDSDRREALQYEQGCVRNALHYGGMEGWIPIWIERNAPSREEMLKKRNPWKSNMHKPTIAQHAAFIVRNMNGDAERLRDDFYKRQAFVSMYLNHHRHNATGLMYWQTDEAIGVDNDPSTFYRPHGSSGSIFLHALMYRELLAMEYLAGCLNMGGIATEFKKEAVKFPSEPVDIEIFQGILFPFVHAGSQIAEARADGIDQTHIDKSLGLHGNGIVEEFAVVVDPGDSVPVQHHPIRLFRVRTTLSQLHFPAQHLIVVGGSTLSGKDVSPKLVDVLILGEETVTAKVHSVSVMLCRSGNTADKFAFLKNDRLDVGLLEELVRGSKARGTRADNYSSFLIHW